MRSDTCMRAGGRLLVGCQRRAPRGVTTLRVFVSAAILVAAVAAATANGATAPRLTVNLETGAINGHVILGKSVAQVARSLGKPSWRVPGTRFYRLGYGDRTDFSLMIRFQKQGAALRAVAVAFERPPLFERRIGKNVLAMTPRAFQSAVARSYGTGFVVTTRLRCTRQLCSLTLRSSDSDRRVTFGTTKSLGAFLTIWVAG